MGWSTVLYMYSHEGWSIGRSAALYMECWGWAGVLYWIVSMGYGQKRWEPGQLVDSELDS